MVTDPATLRFLCDRMLIRLGRYLRAAGYDTAMVAPDEADAASLSRAEAEDRILLSSDRALIERAAPRVRAVWLPARGLDAAAATVGRALAIDWLHEPFTRCLVDNAALRPAGPQEQARLPPRARGLGGEVMLCPECKRLYWSGSHVRRMRARLMRWRQGSSERS